jgi:hypothetical protein
MSKKIKNEAVAKIAEIDVDLSTLREAWVAAKPKNKNSCMRLINRSLDERLTQMKIRDGQ